MRFCGSLVGGTPCPRLMRPSLLSAIGPRQIHDDEFADEGLPIGHKAALTGGQTRQMGEFHPLHCSFDAPQ